LTCITLSKKPVLKNIPSSIKYLNEVSVFKSMSCDYAARLRAIRKVDTEHFFFLDDDDEYGSMAWPSSNLTIGTEYIRIGSIDTPRKQKIYTPATHVLNPQLVHNATCINTSAAIKALKNIPDSGEYYFQLMFYYELIRAGGYVLEPKLKYIWTPSDSGLHTKTMDSVNNTQRYIKGIVI
jgi:hypothetical protein